jgi:pyrimidine operon attenuation protein/uracil phosphoribosyltransferase
MVTSLRQQIKTDKILDKARIESLVSVISDSILKEFSSAKIANIVLLGIQTMGVPLAKRIQKNIEDRKSISIPLGTIDISMYRDDIGTKREISKTHETDIPFDIEDKIIILVDDVLNTGRSIRAALDAVTDYGRPALIRLAVLIDRQMREFPIGADYAGMRKQFLKEKKIVIKWKEFGEEDSVYVYTNKMRKHSPC